MILKADAIFYPANQFWENRKFLFIAEPRSDFKCCFGKPQRNTIYSSLWFWSVAKYKRPIFKGFNSLYYWAGLNLLKGDCFWSCMDASYLSILSTNHFRCIFRYYYDVNVNTDEQQAWRVCTFAQLCLSLSLLDNVIFEKISCTGSYEKNGTNSYHCDQS